MKDEYLEVCGCSDPTLFPNPRLVKWVLKTSSLSFVSFVWVKKLRQLGFLSS